MSTDEYLYRELSEDIVGAAMVVLNKPRPGLKEKAHENAPVIELRKRGHHIEQQRSYDVLYDGIVVDQLIPDLIVDEKVIVDPKCVTDFNETHYAQMIGYLAITGLRLALLFNFKEAKLRWKRIVR
ncbi:MAG TPA: GxxExxY protein [Opitutus sp.]|nr:GxxExxY protein [Opitutus sp.]